MNASAASRPPLTTILWDNGVVMRVVLQYFAGCPNWVEADSLLQDALAAVGAADATIERQRVETVAEAIAVGFIGSPTILLDGRDPFGVEGAEPGLACRIYSIPSGLRGSPTFEQLVAVLRV